MEVKIFLMYYDRFEEATTSLELSKFGIEHIVLCHNNADKFKCIGKTGKLIETNQPKGIQNNFNYGLSMLKPGEWAIFMSDDFTSAQRLVNGWFEKCDIDYPINEIKEAIPKAEAAGINLIGLNAVGNEFYAKKAYSRYGLVDGRTFAIRKTNFMFHPDISTIPDYYATAWHLKNCGSNLILNYTYVDFNRYQKGGLGSISDRINEKIADCKLLKQLFPKNIKYKDKPGQPKYSHVIVKR